jgi:hypothetical protein
MIIINKKEELKVKDNVTIQTFDLTKLAAFYNTSIEEIERRIQNGEDFSAVAETTQTAHNLITSVGKDLFVKRLKDKDATTSRLTHFAVGTVNTAAAAADIALGGEVYRDMITYLGPLYTLASTGVLTVKCYIPAAYPATQPVTLAEAGLFNASILGTLFARVVISPAVNKTNTISMTITWQITAA